MCRRLLIFNLRLLVAWSATILLVLPIHHFATTSKVTARYWKMPTLATVVACMFAVMFAITFRKLRPRLTWPRGVLRSLAGITTIAVLALFVVPSLLGVFYLSVWSTSRPVSQADIPTNATRIDLSCTKVLDHFSGSRKALLERYLASSAAWQVTDDDSRKVALLRRFRGGRWQTEMNMYFPEPDPAGDGSVEAHSSHRTRIYLDGPTQTPSLLDDGGPEAHAGAPSFELPLSFDSHVLGHYQSRLWVRAGEIALSIDDNSDAMERDLTKQKLAEVCADLDRLDRQESTIGIDGLVAEGSVVPSESFSIEDDGQPGIYQAVAYVNPGQKGFVYVKAFDKRSGARLSESETRQKHEYTGWSSAPGHYYYFRVEFFIYEGDWSSTYPAEFQLWFHPEDGSPERQLMTTSRDVNGWER